MVNSVKRYQLVVVNKPNDEFNDAGSQIPILDQPQLRTDQNKRVQITHICCYPITAIPKAPGGGVNAPLADFQNCFLTLNVNSKNNYLLIPLVELNPVRSSLSTNNAPSVNNFFELMTTTKVDWTQSYIQLAGSSSVTTAYNFLFGVRYLYLPEDVAQGANDPLALK